ncbi:MAG: ABC transporter permease, partial [Bacteroidota bacterium]|nr:ABC transporter permease [Bacteroidota bacterium]
MNFPFFIARRYFFAKSIPNVIHIIAGISLAGITLSGFALITILSVFNGFEDLVSRLYNTFDPDLKIIPATGKYFLPDEKKIDSIRNLPYVEAVSPVLEDNFVIIYKEEQSIATFKAIEPAYLKTTGIDSMMSAGEPIIEDEDNYYALLGAGVRAKLSLPGKDLQHPMEVIIPRKSVPFNQAFPQQNLNRRLIMAGGVFSVQQDFDSRYVLLPLEFARELTEEPKKVTSLEIRLKKKANLGRAQNQVEDIMGQNVRVLDRRQQQPSLYKVMRTEKVAVYLILTFILIIAAFNMVGALLMLAIEKKKDMMLLESFGATPENIKNIILYEGLLLSFTGGMAGLALGALVCWLQMQYGFVKIAQGGTFVVNAYPVAFDFTDFILVFVTVVVMGFLASWFPATTAYRKISASELKSTR